jgi:GrpB-like predicted nucleotidyltransferase (UPF0157 family)
MAETDEQPVQMARKIVIVDYRPEWPQEFTAIAHPIQEALGDLALRVDHIGSTAVPGLAAKDVIDIQVTVRDLTPDLEPAFQRAGYTLLEGYTQDHRPPTATGSDRDWEKQMYWPPRDTRRINVHVRRAGSANGRYALLFRDYLRAHPLAALAYGQVKKALSQYGPTDHTMYYDVKDPVCDIIMAGAEDWAAATQWKIEHYGQ